MYEFLVYFLTYGLDVFLFIIPAFFVSLLAGNYARRFAVEKITGKRIQANPLRQLSVSGTVLGILFGYGYGKQQRYDEHGISKGKRILIALSAPFGNILLSVLLVFIQGVIMTIALSAGWLLEGTLDEILFGFNIFIWSSMSMAFVRLLILPGFNGYEVLKILFFDKKELKKLEKSGKWIFFGLAFLCFGLYASEWILFVVSGEFTGLPGLSILYIVIEIPSSLLLKAVTDLQKIIVDLLTNNALTHSGWL